MAQHSLITLSNSSATRLTPNGVHSGMDITLQNLSDGSFIYLGSNEFTSSSDFGFRLSPGNAISFELSGKDSIFAISQDNAVQVAIFKTGLEQGV